MSEKTRNVMLPKVLLLKAASCAAQLGVSTERWIEIAISERIRFEQETAEEFFRKRAAGATGQDLRWALDNAPDLPPMPGDELEP
jgi:hypothetical protein